MKPCALNFTYLQFLFTINILLTYPFFVLVPIDFVCSILYSISNHISIDRVILCASVNSNCISLTIILPTLIPAELTNRFLLTTNGHDYESLENMIKVKEEPLDPDSDATSGGLYEPVYQIPTAWRTKCFKSTGRSALNSYLMNKEMVKIEDKSLEHQPSHRFGKAQKAFKTFRRGSDGEIRRSSSENGSPGKIKKRSDSTESLTAGGDIVYSKGLEKPWVCRNCNRDYKWKNSLKCHLRNECGKPPKYFCSRKCGYKTNVLSNMRRHMNSKFCKPK